MSLVEWVVHGGDLARPKIKHKNTTFNIVLNIMFFQPPPHMLLCLDSPE